MVVEKIRLKGPGAIVFTGPSSCGKGEISSALSQILSVNTDHYISMGETLRRTAQRCKSEPTFQAQLQNDYDIGSADIHNCLDTSDALSTKVRQQREQLAQFFKRDPYA